MIARKAKIALNLLKAAGRFFALANTPKHFGGKVIVFEFLDALLYDWAQVKRFAASGFGGKEIEALFGLKRKAQ